RDGQPGSTGHVAEGPVAPVPIEGERWDAVCRRFRCPAERPAIQQEDVETAVAVVIQEGAAGAHRLRHQLAAKPTRRMAKADPGGGGHIRELDGEGWTSGCGRLISRGGRHGSRPAAANGEKKQRVKKPQMNTDERR